MKGQEGGELPPEVDWMDEEEKKKKEDEDKETEKVSPPPEEGPAQMTEEEAAKAIANAPWSLDIPETPATSGLPVAPGTLSPEQTEAIKSLGGGREQPLPGDPLGPRDPYRQMEDALPAVGPPGPEEDYVWDSDEGRWVYSEKKKAERAELREAAANAPATVTAPDGTPLSDVETPPWTFGYGLDEVTEAAIKDLLGKDTEAFSEEEKAQMRGLIDKEAAQAMSDMSQQMGARGFGASLVAATGLGGIASAAAAQKAEFDIQARQMTIENEINRLKTIASLHGHMLSEANRAEIAKRIYDLEVEKFDYDKDMEEKRDAWIAVENMAAMLGLPKYDKREDVIAELNKWLSPEAAEKAADIYMEQRRQGEQSSAGWIAENEQKQGAGNWITMSDDVGAYVGKEAGTTWSLNKPDWMSDDAFGQLQGAALADEWPAGSWLENALAGPLKQGDGPWFNNTIKDWWEQASHDERLAFQIAAQEALWELGDPATMGNTVGQAVEE